METGGRLIGRWAHLRTPHVPPAMERERIASRRHTRRRRLASADIKHQSTKRVSTPGHPFPVATHHAHNRLAISKRCGAQTETFMQRAALSHTHRRPCFRARACRCHASQLGPAHPQLPAPRTRSSATGKPMPTCPRPQCRQSVRVRASASPHAARHHRPPTHSAPPSAGRQTPRAAPMSGSHPGPGRTRPPPARRTRRPMSYPPG